MQAHCTTLSLGLAAAVTAAAAAAAATTVAEILVQNLALQ